MSSKTKNQSPSNRNGTYPGNVYPGVSDEGQGQFDTRMPEGHVLSPEALKHLGIEPDRPPLFKLFVFLLALAAIVIATGFGLANLLKLSTDHEMSAKVASEYPELSAIRARDQKLLSTYDVIDEKKGIFQVPISQAMTILSQNPKLLEPMTSSPVRGAP